MTEAEFIRTMNDWARLAGPGGAPQEQVDLVRAYVDQECEKAVDQYAAYQKY